MTNSYEIIKSFSKDGQTKPDMISVAPEWVICVLPYQQPFTYNRAEGTSIKISYPDSTAVLRPLIIREDAIQVTASSSKSNYISKLNAQLVPGSRNYLFEILPGDFVFAWMANDKGAIDSIVENLTQGQGMRACNDVRSGLKFFGRAESIRKIASINADGVKTVVYSFSANGFTEFGNSIYYDQQLAQEVSAIGTYLSRLGLTINDLLARSSNAGGISIQELMLTYIKLFFTAGVPADYGAANQPKRDPATPRDEQAGRVNFGGEADYPAILPKEVGQIFGTGLSYSELTYKKAFNYGDLLTVLYGVQKYQSPSDPNNIGEIVNPITYLTGVGDSREYANRLYTGQPLLGTVTTNQPRFTGKPVWNVLKEYLNEAVNEMYVALKVNKQGQIVPTLVIRQLPFNVSTKELSYTYQKNDSKTKRLSKKERELAIKNKIGFQTEDKTVEVTEKVAVTNYWSLPRWIMDPMLVTFEDVGRSDAMRCNFLFIGGSTEGMANQNPTNQVIRNPPYRDDIDIARSGLKMENSVVSSSPQEYREGGPSKWMAVKSDIVMGQHLTVNGSINCYGIQAPISIGDNLEYDGILYHIESIVHTCVVQADGRKQFTTTLSLSHGMNANPPEYDFTDTVSHNMRFYVGVRERDNTQYDPGYASTVQGQGPRAEQKGDSKK